MKKQNATARVMLDFQTRYIQVAVASEEYDRNSWSCNVRMSDSDGAKEFKLNEEEVHMLLSILSSALPREAE